MRRSLATFVLALSFATANAATYKVMNTDDSGAGSLRDAIAQANASGGADTITFDAAVTGTIFLTSGAIKISDALTIVGPGASVLAIDGSAKSRIFNVYLTAPACPALDTAADYLVSISGLTLTHARLTTGNAGGAIYSEHSLALDSMVFDSNVAGQGGALWLKQQYSGQTVTITNSRFVNNVATPVIATPGFPHSAGAVGIEDKCANTPVSPATVIVANSLFSGNRSRPVALNGFGAAIAHYVTYGDITISDTRIVDNRVDLPSTPVAGALYRGGAFYGRAKTVTFLRSEISENGAKQGGAIALVNLAPGTQGPTSTTALNVIDSTISTNAAGASGGALWVYGNVAVNAFNSTIGDNVAPGGQAGGILLTTGPTTPASAGNASAPTLALVSSIAADNAGDDVATSAIAASTLNANDSLIGTICATCGITTVGSGNVSGDPMLDVLDFYPATASTRTHALLLGSPAIRAGSNPLSLDTDQRGPGFPREVNGATDIGAFQFQPAEMLADLTGEVTDLHFQQALGLLANVTKQYQAGNARPACNGLNAFVNQVQAQADKQLTMAEADALVTAAKEIRAALGCD